ncbi:MAG: VWA domain-containing protein [bacterium]|nr:VWA domain-containing protein [bacterium]
MRGMTFLNPWGFAALGGLLAVGIIYLFYQRFKPRRITGLFLWDAPPAVYKGGRKLSVPFVTRSLLLDLLAILLLALALANPALLSPSGAVPVFILDGSLSMRANQNHKLIRSEIPLLLENYRQNRRAVIIEAGSVPALLFNRDWSRGEVGKILKNYEPYSRECDIAGSIALAQELVPDAAEIHVLTDRLPEKKSASLFHYHILKGNYPNQAILEALRRRVEDGAQGYKEKITVSIGNFSATTSEPRLIIRENNTEIHSESFTIPAGSYAQTSIQIPVNQSQLQVEIESQEDYLSADNRALLLPVPHKTLTYQINIKNPRAYASVEKALIACDARKATADEEPHLLVTQSPTEKGAVMTLEITGSGAEGSHQKATALLGPYVIDRAHPLCRDLELTGIYWPLTPGLKPGKEISPLVTAGDTPLYYFRGKDRLCLNLRVSLGNITRATAWPVLFANLERLCRRRIPGLHRVNYSPGDFLQFELYDDKTQNPTTLTGADFEEQIKNTAAAAPLPHVPGIYTLSNKETKAGRVVVNALAPLESDLRQLSDKHEIYPPGHSGLNGSVKKHSQSREIHSIAWIFLLIAAFLVFLNWHLDKREEQEV